MAGSSRTKRALFVAVPLLLLLVVLEGAARIVFFAAEGFNPYYLTYGLVADRQTHSAEFGGYSKYVPGSVVHQKVTGQTIDIRINADGFRGARDFARPKPPGMLRVVALGESSTFGYGPNQDDETWPAQLERALRARDPAAPVEVLNLGIPHYRTNNILALAKAEVAALQPDFIVLYAGYNNAALPRAHKQSGLAYRLKDWLLDHFVAWQVVHAAVKAHYYTFVQVTNRDPVGMPNLAAPARLRHDEVELLRARVLAEYRADVEELADQATRMGARLVLVTQAYTLHEVAHSGLQDRWRSYGEEVQAVERLYSQKGELRAIQSSLLAHRDLMEALRRIAAQRSLPLVDGIAALDRDRPRFMASYVHLTPAGNRALAEAIAPAIRRP